MMLQQEVGGDKGRKIRVCVPAAKYTRVGTGGTAGARDQEKLG